MQKWKWTYRASKTSENCEPCAKKDGAVEVTEIGDFPSFRLPNPDCKGQLGGNPCHCMVEWMTIRDDESGKSVSLDAWVGRVASAWREMCEAMPYAEYSWVSECFDDFVVVAKGKTFWKIPYVIEGEVVTFAPLPEWAEVERIQEWRPKGGETEAESEKADAYAVKALDGDGKIGAYAIRFGSASEPDLSEMKDFFNSDTDFWLRELGYLEGKASAPILYDHTWDETTETEPVVGKWTKAVVDDVGVWLEGQLDKAKKYSEWVAELVKKGVLKLSSDSASHLVRREKQENGTHKILRWPLLAASLTTTPTEPRLLPVESLSEAYKSVGLNYQQIAEWEAKMDKETIDLIAEAVAAKIASPPAEEKPKGEEAKGVTPDIQSLVEQASEAVMTRLAEMPALKAAGFAAKGEGPFYNKTPHNMDNVKAFNLYLHFGEKLQENVKSLLRPVYVDERGEVKAALNVGTVGQGGYLVPDEFAMELIKAKAERSHLRMAQARTITIPDIANFEYPTMTFGAAAALTAEAAAYDQVEPTFGAVVFVPYKYTRLVKASEEVVADSRFDIWSQVILPDWVQAFAAAENTAFTTGSGSSQPQGVVTGAGTGKTAASATAITADEIIDLFYSLNHEYRELPSCHFMMNDAIAQYVRKLKDGNGNYLWGGDLTQGQGETLLGKPVQINNSMASTVATTNKTMLFGAFDYFYIGDRTALVMRRLDELYSASGQIGFRGFMRFDSHVMLAAAFKLLVQA